MLRFAFALVLAFRLAASPVSYNRDIAPILAMKCHTCHGANPDSAAANLSTRTWQELMRGGKMGAVVIPGRPAESPLLQFVDGSRGEEHRMPLGEPPLSAAEIELIRRWIAEGALADEDRAPTYRLELPSVAFPPSRPVRFFCRLPVAGYVELELTGADGRTLHLDGRPVTTADWLHWDLRRGRSWPATVRVRLTISHVASEPLNAVFATTTDLQAGAADIRVLSWPGERVIFQGEHSLPAGLAGLAQWLNRFEPGWYVVHLRRPAGEASVLLRKR